MAKNDMYVIMYKILAYLDECMRKNVDVNDDKFSHIVLGISEKYWAHIIDELVCHKYVRGVNVIYTTTEPIICINNPRVTMEGVAFMQENSMMKKAREFLKETKSILPLI